MQADEEPEFLFASGTYWKDAEQILRGAEDRAVVKSCFVDFAGGNRMVIPLRELRRRAPEWLDEIDRLRGALRTSRTVKLLLLYGQVDGLLGQIQGLLLEGEGSVDTEYVGVFQTLLAELEAISSLVSGSMERLEGEDAA
jgi:hypothetical protein